MVQGYPTETIFDKERTEIVPLKWWGGTHLDNWNKVINNNTKWRILNQNEPIDPKIKPLEDQGINKNSWNQKLAMYEPGFKGVVRRKEEKGLGVRSTSMEAFADPIEMKKKAKPIGQTYVRCANKVS